MQNYQDWNQQPGNPSSIQQYPNDPPPSYDMAMGQATAPPGTYKINVAPTGPHPQASLPHMVYDGRVYNFPHNNGVCATYPTQPSVEPYMARVNHSSQPPGTQQTIIVSAPMPSSDEPLVLTQPRTSARRTCTGVAASLLILLILMWILFRFFIRMH